MKRASVLVVSAVWVACCIAGCKEKSTDSTPPPIPDTATVAPPPAPPPPVVPPAPTTTASAAPADTLPTSEDFEQEALDTITSVNIEAELDRLEKEIGK